MFKSEIRILGFDDGSFDSRKGKVPVIGVIFRGGKWLDGVLRTDVEVDGNDATEKLIKSINSSRHKQQLKMIMLDGITMGGFNIVDAIKLNEETNLPVIVINRIHPDLKKVKAALEKNFEDWEKRWRMIENAGQIKKCSLRSGINIFYQSLGIPDSDAEDAIRLSTTHSQIPEVLRVAHLIGTAIVKGESSGRA